MKIILWTCAIMAALITGVLLGRAGVIDFTASLVLMAGSLAGLLLLYPSARKQGRK